MKLHLNKSLSNQEISEVFRFIAGVLEVQDTNPYKVAAYRNASATISTLNVQLKDIYKDSHHDFDQLPSIGERIAKKLDELFKTGDIKAFQKYCKNIPSGTYQLAQVEGIGVKTAYKLAKEFKLPDSNEALKIILEKAERGKIRDIEGFGEKSEEDLLNAVKIHSEKNRMPLSKAMKLSDQLIGELKKCPVINRLEVLGSIRRKAKTIGDIDIGLATNDIGSVKPYVKSMKSVKKVIVAGDNLIRLILNNGIQVDLKVSPLSEWGSFLQHFTGSKEHNIKLRQYALKKGLSLSEHGINIKPKGKNKKPKVLLFDSEGKFYEYLGLNFIQPEERIGGDEIERYMY